jgi:hypothetical protein
MSRPKIAAQMTSGLTGLIREQRPESAAVDLEEEMKDFLGADVYDRAPTLFKQQAEALVKLRMSLDAQQAQLDLILSNPLALSVNSNVAMVNRHRKSMLDLTKATSALTVQAITLGLIDDRKATREKEKKAAAANGHQDEELDPTPSKKGRIVEQRRIFSRTDSVN